MQTNPNYFQAFESDNLPLYSMATHYVQGQHFALHQHTRAQLLYAVQGIMLVETVHGHWIVPPQHAVWLAAGQAHAVSMLSPVDMRSLFIHPAMPVSFAQGICVLNVSPLLRELIIASSEISNPYTTDSREGRISALIIDELNTLSPLPFYLPWPQDEKLQQVCQAIMQQPANEQSIADIANTLGISKITFQRQFQQQSGMNFGEWRQQARLLLALQKLAQGEKIVGVALSVGYSSQSAFSARFKQFFGQSPSSFYKGA